MLILGALVVVAVVVVLVAVLSSGGGSSNKASTPAAANTGTTTSSTSATSGTTPKAQAVSQSNLLPPSGSTSKAKGIGVVVKEGTAYGIIIEAAHVAPNSHNAYAAWLYNSPTDAYRLGFVNPPVGKNGQLEVGSPLPANAGHYRQLLLTLETESNPKSPGTVVLQGPFSLTSSAG
jgi:hypothetical protein